MLALIKTNLGYTSDYNDPDFENLVNHYIDTAKAYMYGATGKEFDEKNPIHKNIVILLATHFYENRNIAITNDLDRTLASMFLQAGLQRKEKND